MHVGCVRAVRTFTTAGIPLHLLFRLLHFAKPVCVLTAVRS